MPNECLEAVVTKKNKFQMDFLASHVEDSGLIHESENMLCPDLHSKIFSVSLKFVFYIRSCFFYSELFFRLHFVRLAIKLDNSIITNFRDTKIH